MCVCVCICACVLVSYLSLYGCVYIDRSEYVFVDASLCVCGCVYVCLRVCVCLLHPLRSDPVTSTLIPVRFN